MRKLGLREVHSSAQSHTAKSPIAAGSRSISGQNLLHSVISKPCVFVHKRTILPAQGAIIRIEDDAGRR